MDGRQHVVFTHCVAHRLELWVLSGIKDHPMLVTVQEMLYQMLKHYYYSPKTLRELKTIAESMEDRFIKPQQASGDKMASTCWTKSIYGCSEGKGKTSGNQTSRLTSATFHGLPSDMLYHSCRVPRRYGDGNLMLVQLQAEPGEKFKEFTSHIHQNQDGCWQFKGQPIKHFDPDRLYDFRNVAESVMDKMNT
ncbi:hypothetical protein MAR_006625, partial [Mya arenaria]